MDAEIEFNASDFAGVVGVTCPQQRTVRAAHSNRHSTRALLVIPAQAGIQTPSNQTLTVAWIPAYAGMTGEEVRCSRHPGPKPPDLHRRAK